VDCVEPRVAASPYWNEADASGLPLRQASHLGTPLQAKPARVSAQKAPVRREPGLFSPWLIEEQNALRGRFHNLSQQHGRLRLKLKNS